MNPPAPRSETPSSLGLTSLPQAEPLPSIDLSVSGLASLFGAEHLPSETPISASDLASLFRAEPTPSQPTADLCTASRSALRAAQLSRLRTRPHTPPLKEDKNPELTSLRHQLELLLAENMITERLRQTKSAIIQRIRVLEAEEKKRVEDEKKVRLSKKGLPEPIAKGEKEKLMKASKKIAKAKIVGEVSCGSRELKRKRAHEEEDLDGEERLRLGLEVRKKKKKTKANGKWFSDIYGVK